jgi:hypothetical protein
MLVAAFLRAFFQRLPWSPSGVVIVLEEAAAG